MNIRFSFSNVCLARTRFGCPAVFVLFCLTAAVPSPAVAQHQGITVMQPETGNVIVPGEGESVPMLDFGGRPVVDVMINGKGPFSFIFDTGASVNVIDSSLVDEIGKSTASSAEDTKLDELRVGTVVIRDLRVSAHQISRMFGKSNAPRGVLSASSFPGNLVNFDYPARKITFSKGALKEPDGKTTFNYDPADLPSLPVKVAGREITVHFDTGAPYALALPTKYMKELSLAAAPIEKGKAMTHAGTLPVFGAPLNGDISIGEYTIPTRDLQFTDVVPFASVEPKGQVGNEAVRELVVTLDSLNHRIGLEKPKTLGH
jgi:hypothetical protein